MRTLDEYKAILQYDTETGIFTRIADRGGPFKIGRKLTAINTQGYAVAKLFDKHMQLHRLAWAFVYGEFPIGEVDHINGNRADNRISNLRLTDRQRNAENQRKPGKGNTSGFLGVCHSLNKYRAQIRHDGKKKHLGTFDTPELAYAAYVAAKRELHPGCTI